MARVRNSVTAEWSPLTEAHFRVGTVPADASNIVIDELMYHPPDPSAEEIAAGFTDSDEFEFIALLNIGGAPVDVSGLRFAAGISFDFGAALRTVVEPGGRLVLGRNGDALRHRYGAAAVDPLFAVTRPVQRSVSPGIARPRLLQPNFTRRARGPAQSITICARNAP